MALKLCGAILLVACNQHVGYAMPWDATLAEVGYSAPTANGARLLGPTWVGDQVRLAPGARTLTSIQISYSMQINATATIDVGARIYANDGPNNIPETILWDSGILANQLIHGREFVTFNVPNLVVPAELVFMTRILGSRLCFAVRELRQVTHYRQQASFWITGFSRVAGQALTHFSQLLLGCTQCQNLRRYSSSYLRPLLGFKWDGPEWF